MITSNQAQAMLNSCSGLTFPLRMELNFHWVIGAPALQQLDSALQEAIVFQLNGLDGTLSHCDDRDMRKCRFSECGSSVAAQTINRDVIDARDRRHAQCVAPFPEPYVITWLRKNTVEPFTDRDGVAMEQQNWFPWQTCTNCRAVRSATLCSHWHTAMSIANVNHGGQVQRVRRGQQSDLDREREHDADIVAYYVSQELHTL